MARSLVPRLLAVAAAVAALCFPISAEAASSTRSITGVVDVLQEDYFDSGRTRRVHFLHEESTGKTYTLQFEREPGLSLLSGSTITAHGELDPTGQVLAVAEVNGIEVLEKSGAATFGERHALVLVVNFQDANVSCSESQVTDLIFDGTWSIDGLYRESSYDVVSFPGDTDNDGQSDVFAVTIDFDTSSACNPSGWAQAADALAAGAAVDLGLYEHRVYVLPTSAPCGWAGYGNVGCGGAYCRSWTRHCSLPDVYAHELGHNLGLGHASTDDDNDGQTDCTYCDVSDFMGYGGMGWRQVNGAHKDQLGWLPAEQIVEINDFGTQNHSLAPLETDPGATALPQLLQLQDGTGGSDYYVSYRRRIGYDLNMNANYADQTSIHRMDDSGYVKSKLVAVLDDNETFEDSAVGITVTQLSHDSASVTLQVTTSEPCTSATPQVSSVPTKQSSRPGDPVAQQAMVVNTDTAACGPTTFDLTASLPAGWTASPAVSSVSLQPGEQALLDLEVTSAVSTTDGNYGLNFMVGDGSDPAHDESALAEYIVDGTPPLAISPLMSAIFVLPRRTIYYLWWDPTVDTGVGVETHHVYRNGGLLASTTGMHYRNRNLPSGTYQYYVIVEDKVGNLSAPSNVIEITVP